MFKERADAERAAEEARIAHKKKIVDACMFALYFLAGSAILFSVIFIGVQVYGSMEEQKIYERKVAARAAVLHRQAKEREEAQRKEALDAVK